MSAFRHYAQNADRFVRKSKQTAARGAKRAGNFKIERGVPIPPPHGTGGPRVKGYTAVLRMLQVGDRVLLPQPQPIVACLGNRILGGGCYVTRSAGNGTYIWRTK